VRRPAQLVLLFLTMLATENPGAMGQGITAGPQFAPGQVLRYELNARVTHDGDTSGAVENPQGGGRLTVGLAASLKLEVLEPDAGATRVRATIEQVSIAVGGDTFDPFVAGIEGRYRQLEGYSRLFIVPPADSSQPPEPVAPKRIDGRLEATAQSWMRTLVLGMGAPADSMPGGVWTKEQALAEAPLKETVLRVQSTYLRDEPCGGQAERADAGVPSLAAQPCALILARSTLGQAGSRRDPTPDTYRERGLRTAGKWEGSGESLAYVAHRTGWLVSITETQEESLDFTVSRAGGETVLRQRGRVETETHLLLQSVEMRK